jgi:predicted phosphodiesterase
VPDPAFPLPPGFELRRRAFLALSLAVFARPWRVAAAVDVTLPRRPDSLKFAVIGDSGSGSTRQYDTARQFVAAHEQFPFEFVLMLGDNIYGGESPADLVKKFEAPYKPLLDAGVDFYAALGNHDDPRVQLKYELFHMKGKRFYTFRKGPAQFFALDSTFVGPDQIKWFETELSKSDAPWKIAYMHHPIYSSGRKHGSDLPLRAALEPLIIGHDVDVVMAGHEHFYERIKPQRGVQYFTAGSAGKLREGNIATHSILTAAGYDTDLSFMLMEIEGDELSYQVISRLGRTVDRGQMLRRAARTTG